MGLGKCSQLCDLCGPFGSKLCMCTHIAKKRRGTKREVVGMGTQLQAAFDWQAFEGKGNRLGFDANLMGTLLGKRINL